MVGEAVGAAAAVMPQRLAAEAAPTTAPAVKSKYTALQHKGPGCYNPAAMPQAEHRFLGKGTNSNER